MNNKPFLKKKPPKEPDVVFADLGVAKVILGNGQHCGARPYQEDSFGFSSIEVEQTTTKGILAVLADGMGGLKNGKAVSDDMVSNLLNWFDAKGSVCRNAEDLRGVVTTINSRICDIYCSEGTVTSGSTLVTALICGGVLHWLCIGDSRLYLKRNGKLHAINEDHDYLNQLLDNVIEDDLSLQEAFEDPKKACLAECIGKRMIEKMDYSKQGYRLQDGDVLVLCSDGVYNALGNAEFTSLITQDAMASCNNIINTIAAKGFPEQDNNTIVILSYKE